MLISGCDLLRDSLLAAGVDSWCKCLGEGLWYGIRVSGWSIVGDIEGELVVAETIHTGKVLSARMRNRRRPCYSITVLAPGADFTSLRDKW